jgi:hypothetical protein
MTDQTPGQPSAPTPSGLAGPLPQDPNPWANVPDEPDATVVDWQVRWHDRESREVGCGPDLPRGGYGQWYLTLPDRPDQVAALPSGSAVVLVAPDGSTHAVTFHNGNGQAFRYIERPARDWEPWRSATVRSEQRS